MNIQKNFRSAILAALAIALTTAAPASAKLSLANEEGAVPANQVASGPGEVRYAQVVGAWGDGSSRRIYRGGGGGGGGHHHHNHNYHDYHGGYRHHGGWYGGYGPGWGGWGGWGGPNIGVVVDIPIYPRYRPIYRGAYVGGSAHHGWCAQRYRSYRAWDNTFQPYNGPRRYCISPYR
jgi:hypothetical protein